MALTGIWWKNLWSWNNLDLDLSEIQITPSLQILFLLGRCTSSHNAMKIHLQFYNKQKVMSTTIASISNKYQVYSYFTIWFRSLPVTQIRSIIPWLRNKPLILNLFRTSNIDVVKCCQEHFGFDVPGVIWSKWVKKFEAKFLACNNLLCKFWRVVACSNSNLFLSWYDCNYLL